MKNKIDWPSEWFRATEELGENVNMVFGQMKEGADKPNWFEYPHYDYDGISGLAHLLRSQDCKVPPLPVLKGDSFSFFRILRGMAAYLPTSGVRQQQWRRFDPTTKRPLVPVQERMFWHLFSEEDTKKISLAAKSAGVTVNTYLLFHLDAAVASQLTSPSASRRWSIPVNLRGAITRPTEQQVHMAFLAVDLEGDFSLKQLHSKIIKLKERGYHWGVWVGFLGGAMLGKPGMRKYLVDRRKQGECWTGTFSNLGVWEVPNSGNCFFCPNELLIYPIGAGCITMNGRLSISLQLNAAFGDGAEIRQSLLNSWKEACLSE